MRRKSIFHTVHPTFADVKKTSLNSSKTTGDASQGPDVYISSPCCTSKSSCWYSNNCNGGEDERYDSSVVVVVGSGGVAAAVLAFVFKVLSYILG